MNKFMQIEDFSMSSLEARRNVLRECSTRCRHESNCVRLIERIMVGKSQMKLENLSNFVSSKSLPALLMLSSGIYMLRIHSSRILILDSKGFWKHISAIVPTTIEMSTENSCELPTLDEIRAFKTEIFILNAALASHRFSAFPLFRLKAKLHYSKKHDISFRVCLWMENWIWIHSTQCD